MTQNPAVLTEQEVNAAAEYGCVRQIKWLCNWMGQVNGFISAILGSGGEMGSPEFAGGLEIKTPAGLK